MSNQPNPPASSPTPATQLSDEIFPGGWKRFLFPSVFLFMLFAALFWRRPAKQRVNPYWVLRGYIFGTTYTIKVRPMAGLKTSQKDLKQKVEQVLQKVDMQMSTYKKKSELSLFNRSRLTTPIKASKPFLKVVNLAKQINAMTGGAFDVTIGPIVNAWGFGPTKRLKQPPAAVIAAAKKRIGSQHLEVDLRNLTIRKKIPQLYVDLSAIAKGYGVDDAGRMLETLGFVDYLVEIGGEVRARGKNARGFAWRIGIEKPSTGGGRAIQLIVPLRNTSMATSGNYRNYVMVDGRLVSHLIDARTAAPVSHSLASVTVVHANCAMADALATAFFVLGPKAGLKLAEQKQLAVLFLVPKGKSFVRKSTKAFDLLLDKPKRKGQY